MKISDSRRYTVLCTARPTVREVEQTAVGCTVQYIYGGRITSCETGFKSSSRVTYGSNWFEILPKCDRHCLSHISKGHKPHPTTQTSSSRIFPNRRITNHQRENYRACPVLPGSFEHLHLTVVFVHDHVHKYCCFPQILLNVFAGNSMLKASRTLALLYPFSVHFWGFE
jgi:hypothetical protein